MRYKILVIGIVSAFAFSSCNLDYSETTNYGKDYMQLNFDNVASLLSDIYARLDYDFGNYDEAMLASASDEAMYAWESNRIHNFYNGSWSPANSLTNWDGMFVGIQACNHYLANYLGLTFPELMENDDYKAQMFRYENYEHEVRFLRAYFYFNLVRQYGDVPLVKEEIPAGELNQLSRTSYKDVIDYIISECDAVIPKLPADYTNLGEYQITPAQNGRATMMAAMALKARTLLYAASPLFNDGSDSQLWYKAAKAAKDLLDVCTENGKRLEAYTRIWGTDNWQSNEAILVRRILNNSNSLETRNFPVGVEHGNSGNCPTQNMIDAYQMKASGKFWDEAESGYDPANPYEGRDPRFGMSIVKNGDTGWPSYNRTAIQTYFGGVNGEPVAGATPTGYYLKKLLDGTLANNSGSLSSSRHNFVTYRLGEFYLNYAEAVFRHSGSADATSGEFSLSAREAVNIVRARTGVEMPALPAGLSNDEFWKQYTNERMVELAFEGHRFWDVRRWKEADRYFKSITQMKITRNADDTYSYERRTVSRQWEDKMYFFPIPQAERMKNPNLAQNAGW
ncbi:MAG: RagB/SusD family nutrient uptake outer membrane protein [Tannerella sp.]|jgi:hypothetical protein|nr:RagB/SusD family nutrient uptake outer membrane protein [Tannerella sp.]